MIAPSSLSPRVVWRVSLLVAAGALIAGCGSGGGSHHASGSTPAPASSTSSTSVATATTPPTSATTPPTTAPTTPPTAPPTTIGTADAAIAGSYVAGTADGGTLYIRSDGASRFSAPDDVACPTCSTAGSPLGTLDFSLKTLTPTGSGSYRATGVFTETSDPAWAHQLSPSATVGAAMSLTDDNGAVTLSFLPSPDILRATASSQ